MSVEIPVEKLIEMARSSRDGAYAPYSNFHVGAALLTAKGKVYCGCNIENASYGLTVCAERVAIFKAISEGERHFTAVAVISNDEDYCSPCGACRQVLAEFGGHIKVYLCNNKGEYRMHTVSELLPASFGMKLDAGKGQVGN